MEKQESRRHQALEKEFSRAQRQAREEAELAGAPEFDLPLGPSTSAQGDMVPARPPNCAFPTCQGESGARGHLHPYRGGAKGDRPSAPPPGNYLEALISRAVDRALVSRSHRLSAVPATYVPQSGTPMYHGSLSPSRSSYAGPLRPQI